MEVMLGRVVSRYEHGDKLCGAEDSFRGRHWTTMTRMGHMEASQEDNCPLMGQYSGTLPDGEGLCARSDKNNTYAQKLHHLFYSDPQHFVTALI